MSRRDFRARVGAPRPASAWALVTVASATLWITQQLDPPVVAAQGGAILLSLFRRTHPFRWQRSPVWLNVGMFAIVAVTIAVASRGDPSTIALAHFAALTQGLQLLDARPRRTEFLLVALALFQVVLAANLTDSVFFTPLLVAFVFSAVWTLLVHTLHSEALEAGEAGGPGRALTPGLLRVTLFASACSVVLGLVLFVTLPRLRSNVVTGAGFGVRAPTSGFSERVSLGEIGRIRRDPGVVLRVETLEGRAPAEAYWRGLAFDHFDGESWRVTPSTRTLVPGSAEGGVTIGSHPENANLVQQIVREGVAAGVLFAAGPVRRLQGTVRRLERDAGGGLYAAGQADERVRYIVATRRGVPPDEGLRRDRAIPPRRDGARYLQLPVLRDETRALAHAIAEGATSDADRARAIERHLRRAGRYTDDPPALDAARAGSHVEAFLFGELAGHCEYFASAMVLLARSLGIPARLVNGFAGGRENRIGGFVEVRRSDAHAWVEIHYERAGWVRYDPTPPDLRARSEDARSLAARLRDLGSALELWWFQRIVGFDRADQIRTLKSAWLAWQERLRSSRAGEGRSQRRRASARGLDERSGGRELAIVLACACGAGGIAWRLRRARRRAGAPGAYEDALRLLARRGLVRRPADTAREFAASVRTVVSEDAAETFARLTEDYLAQRFGGRPAPSSRAVLRELRFGLRRR